MTACLVRSVRHVGLGVPDLSAARSFYESVWGLVANTTTSDAVFLAAAGSPEAFVLRLRKAPEQRLDLVSLAVDSRIDVDRLAELVTAAGCRLSSEPGRISTPGGGYGFRFFDPDGRTIEISAEVAPRVPRVVAPREAIPVGLSHVVLNTADMARMTRFLVDVLGFRVSDYLEDKMVFLRCGEPHHAIAIAGSPHTSLNHVAYELRDVDDYMFGTGRVSRSGQRLIWGPGRHGPGDNTFSYFEDPARFVCEYTTGLEAIRDESTHEPRVYRSIPEESDLWGTAGVRLAEPFLGTPDPGAWTPPPF
ncbi:MAG: VOC family protein [Acidimicrobiales bacterium]